MLLTDEDREKLKKKAAKMGKTVAALIRETLLSKSRTD